MAKYGFGFHIHAGLSVGEPNGGRRRFDRLFGGNVLVVAIPSKRLVSAFAVENDFIAAFELLPQSKGWDRRAVGERFVVVPHQLRKAFEGSGRIDAQDFVRQTQVLGNADGVREVRMAVAEVGGEGRELGALERALGGDHRRIDASAQKHCDGDIRTQTETDGTRERPRKRSIRSGRPAGGSGGAVSGRHQRFISVTRPSLKRRKMARFKLAAAIENREGGGHVAEGEIRVHGRRVETPFVERGKSFQFACEGELAGALKIDEGLSPTRSRASVNSRRAASQRAKANMPTELSRAFSTPHSAQARSRTSVSEPESNAPPSSARNSR